MNKENIRKYFLQKRRFYLDHQLVNLNSASESVCNNFIEFFNSNYKQIASYKKSNAPLTVALYFPLLYEINILKMIPFFTALNTRVCLPCIIKNSKILQFAYYSLGDELKNSVFNTKEPLKE